VLFKRNDRRLDATLGELTSRWRAASDKLTRAELTPSSEARQKLRVLQRAAGYVDRQLEDLESKERLLPPDEPETTSEPSPVPSYASAPQPPLPAVVGVDKKKSKVTQRKGTGVATNQPLPTRAPAAVSTSPAPAAPTRLSFADIISGQLVRNLFNLH